MKVRNVWDNCMMCMGCMGDMERVGIVLKTA